MDIPFLAASEVEELVPIRVAIEALRSGFSERSVMDVRAILNLADEPPLRTFLSMPARLNGTSGAKLVTLFEENVQAGKPAVQGVYVLFSSVDGRVRAILDGAVLTKIRTPAASALATDYLADPSADRLALFGTGLQAAAHLEAMLAVRPSIERVEVVSGTQGRAIEFAAKMATRFEVHMVAATNTAADAPVVCTTTRAWSHLFGASQLAGGSHINAVGAFLPSMAEFGPDVVEACEVWVDHIDSSRVEAGELIQAAESGSWEWSRVRGDLTDLVSGTPRFNSGSTTLFRNVGLSIEDLIVATRAADMAGLDP